MCYNHSNLKKERMIMKTDVLIIGSGCSGLYCALHLPETMQAAVITKSDLESSDSFLAQEIGRAHV